MYTARMSKFADLAAATGGDPDKFLAAIDLIERTGADSFMIRFCDEEEPVIWSAMATWPEMYGNPEHWDVCSGVTPWQALFRLCEAAIDGGSCKHCKRPTAVDDKPADPVLMITEEHVCWYRYDPELRTFRRQCEGK
jgi:hypothetical protein